VQNLLLFSVHKQETLFLVEHDSRNNCLHMTSHRCKLTLYVTRSPYIIGLLYTTAHTCLCSADQHKLFVPRTSTSTFGSRAFSSSSPLFWNALPPQLRDPAISISIFRQSLKTHLFNNNSDWQCVIVVLYIYCYYRFSSVPLPHALLWQFLFS